ncbi:uncharacterized protein LOC120650166 isoform X2 [Panicum virgatum]|uniref:uncharacterized protein LOC120650166 isoform X2 n=1 Tax=Panicum virgatum TaxID=38727 RepID=UPI0019D5ED3E|nr:uncharacterized protein LOC120650166 isoform X2 [Panicum virgatum]
MDGTALAAAPPPRKPPPRACRSSRQPPSFAFLLQLRPLLHRTPPHLPSPPACHTAATAMDDPHSEPTQPNLQDPGCSGLHGQNLWLWFANNKAGIFFYGSNPPSTAKEDNTANQSVTNCFAEDKTNQDSNIKPSKRQKHSSEPKTVNAFQRVRLEDVKFADERLQDNSYWAKGGGETGFDAKAQEILGQVEEGAFGVRRPRRSAEHTGVDKLTYKLTRSSLTIRMTSDRLASPKMGVGRSLLHLAADHFYGQLPDQSCSGWKVLEVRWCYVVNYRSHMSSARNLKL